MRTGNLTSSGIVAITSVGKRDMTAKELEERPKKGTGSKTTTIEDENIFSDAGLTYIEEKNIERRLGRSLEKENNAKACAWGNLCEIYVQSKHEYVSIDYTQRPDEPIQNKVFPHHCGTPDMTKSKTVADIKSPFTLKSFCTLVQPIYHGLIGLDAMNALRNGYTDPKGIKHKKHDEGNTYYWQLISNAILTDSQFAELHIFCPYQKELVELRELAQKEGLSKYYFIAMGFDDDFPYLKEDGYYRNYNIIRFEIPQADKDFLIKRIQLAGKYLEPFKTPIEKREIKEAA